jgi:hypothetical protein
MKKILMLLPLLAFLAGCKKEDESMSSPPATATTNAASTNAPAK